MSALTITSLSVGRRWLGAATRLGLLTVLAGEVSIGAPFATSSVAAELQLAQAQPLPRPHPQRSPEDPIGDFLDAAAALFGLADEPNAVTPPLLDEFVSADFLLTSAYRRLQAGDVDTAARIARAMPDPTGALLIEWLIATDGYPDIPPARLAEAAAFVTDWPGQNLMQIRFEQAVLNDSAGPDEFVATLGGTTPILEATTLRLAHAYRALERETEATELIGTFWRNGDFSREAEEMILADFADLLSPDDHYLRMSRLLYASENDAAVRTAEQLSTEMQRLAEAWVAANRGRSGAAALLDEVPIPLQADPGYLYARLRLLMRSGTISVAASLLQSAPTDPVVLINPEAWSVQRRVVARWLTDRGDNSTAYEVVSGHSAAQRNELVEAEFQAGWIALRLVGDAESAISHFEALAASSTLPLSQSRAHYWIGRSHDALGRPEAAEPHFRIAAGYHTTFYGQLALVRLGEQELQLSAASIVSDSVRASFAANDQAQSMVWLYDLGRPEPADILARSLAGSMTDPNEIALLATLAEGRGDYQLALQIGKLAANRGLAVDSVAFSTSVIPREAIGDRVESALVYAVARQESAFNTSAQSSAGALGLLQILPSTAREMAGLIGLGYTEARLTSDPAYNATLGGAYLGSLLDRYDGSLVLALAAFNAGPSRADRWIVTYGDPRRGDVDPIDWIERIPFNETRNYVQRVLENLQVYRARLGDTELRLARDLDL